MFKAKHGKSMFIISLKSYKIKQQQFMVENIYQHKSKSEQNQKMQILRVEQFRSFNKINKYEDMKQLEICKFYEMDEIKTKQYIMCQDGDE
ncbi:unnamed protein product [Paramecium octaurelia]|uniref:Uncharacterized protein n=1 Tax=Paramecium octaurelia TaxID=43137 RepID=A0A8S1SZ81_PAROT|nr:unnamed protein product [Paramecium octaurelia]